MQLTCNAHPCAPVHSWECTTRLWARLYVEFAEPVKGKLFLIVVYTYSKLLKVRIVSSTSAESVVGKLRCMLATHGLPDVVDSDNETAFTSENF